MPDQSPLQTLIVDPNRTFRIWKISEIYNPDVPNSGVYVPNVDDAVWDWNQGLLRVTAVDYTTGRSVLHIYTAPKDPGAGDDSDILLGAGPGTQFESYRVYLDQSVMPHTFAIDSRIHIYGTAASYVKIFKGTDISNNGQVISAMYDQNGTLLGENIPLELVAMNDTTNLAVKTPKVGYTLQNLVDGEVVTAVVYNTTGAAVSRATMLVQNSAFIRTTDASAKYISSISLETPFLSQADPKLIQYPINMPISALNLMGVVTYSDGSKLRLPCDGSKFSVYGLQNYIATIEGQTIPLVLSYKLSPGEYNYVGTPSPNQHISEEYRATTTKADGAYTVKLFCYPVWIDALNGYRLEYFLYNLDRDDVYPVTNLVNMGTDSRAFNPTQYGTVQHIGVAIDLNTVDASFAAYRHVQGLDITLLRHGDDHTGDNWTVGYSPGQNPPFGVSTYADVQFIDVGNWKVRLDCGLTSKQEWLDRVFYATQPLFDPDTEEEAPEPNIMVLVTGNNRLEIPIAQWNSVATVVDTMVDGGLLYIEWIKRDSQNDLQLGVTGFIVRLTQAGV